MPLEIIGEYERHCAQYDVPFERHLSVRPYDPSTLFCPAGMQRYKPQFKDESFKDTLGNVQSCIRMKDFTEIGDTTHYLYFNMLGLFSFRSWWVPDAIEFWMKYMERIGLKVDYVTRHPDCNPTKFSYANYPDVPVRMDSECVWSDGEIGGFCTEFYVNGIEVGNIVNPMGDCIDVGFGVERLDMLVNGTPPPTRLGVLESTIRKIIDAGYKPSNTKQGYVLRKLLRAFAKEGGTMNHPFFKREVERQQRLREKYDRMKDKYAHMPDAWWFDTHGIDRAELD